MNIKFLTFRFFLPNDELLELGSINIGKNFLKTLQKYSVLEHILEPQSIIRRYFSIKILLNFFSTSSQT